ncbi:S4 domain-containing protein YaaA [Macrococcus carouselicus]|uniref:S4 domain-containing protein YaaA n=1 Tax=Macrococcus carouselicus TaxID=69969 RepID=A0A9Q8FQN8_9STAP|nr:S4 domain-containing protein YaaA [Macrococcus carouselicus]TDM02175.1 S4 domain-containing protein YaaA [Macrococcus carouselicus]
MLNEVEFDSQITLGQLLKSEGIIGTGGQAKWFLQENTVYLNGTLETRRGKKLAQNDIVDVEGVGKFKISYSEEG